MQVAACANSFCMLGAELERFRWGTARVYGWHVGMPPPSADPQENNYLVTSVLLSVQRRY